MFDTLVVRPASPSVHVHNETKPHDPADAARLYGELERRAEQKVASATIERLGAENEITAAVVHQTRDYMTDRDRARVMFKINGVQYDFELDWDRTSLEHEMARAIVEQLVSNVQLRLRK